MSSADEMNYQSALQWLRDVARGGPNTGVQPSGVLMLYARALVERLEHAPCLHERVEGITYTDGRRGEMRCLDCGRDLS